MAGALVPEDDLYARLEVDIDASPEAIELAWRALLKRHHPDVAGDTDASLERAKRINVAHDWLSDAGLRVALRPGAPRPPCDPAPRPDRRPPRPSTARLAAATGAAAGRTARSRRSTRPDLARGDPAERLARFLDRVVAAVPGRARPPRRRRAAADRVPGHDPALRHARGRGRVRGRRGRRGGPRPSRALGGGGASGGAAGRVRRAGPGAVPRRHAGRAVPRPRPRPAAARMGGLDRPAALRAERRRGRRGAGAGRDDDRDRRSPTLLHASAGVPGDDRPVAAGPRPRRGRGAPDLRASSRPGTWRRRCPGLGLAPATATRARRLLGRGGHVTALRHAFPAATYASLMAPFVAATGGPVARAGAAGVGRGAGRPPGALRAGPELRPGLQDGQAARPRSGDGEVRADAAGELPEAGDGLGPERVVDPGPAPLAVDPAGVAEHLEVVRHRGLADVAAGREVAGAHLGARRSAGAGSRAASGRRRPGAGARPDRSGASSSATVLTSVYIVKYQYSPTTRAGAKRCRPMPCRPIHSGSIHEAVRERYAAAALSASAGASCCGDPADDRCRPVQRPRARRAARRRRPRVARLRQPDRRRRPPPGRARAGPRLRRRDRRPAVGEARRADRARVRPRHDRRDAGSRAAQRGRGRAPPTSSSSRATSRPCRCPPTRSTS